MAFKCYNQIAIIKIANTKRTLQKNTVSSQKRESTVFLLFLKIIIYIFDSLFVIDGENNLADIFVKL